MNPLDFNNPKFQVKHSGFLTSRSGIQANGCIVVSAVYTDGTSFRFRIGEFDSMKAFVSCLQH